MRRTAVRRGEAVGGLWQGAGMRADEVLGRVLLVTGKEELFNERLVAGVREAVRGHDPEAELSETSAADLTGATLGELASPSLFSSVRCVVVRALENLPEDSAEALLDYCAAPADDVALVLVHGGGPKGARLLARLRKLPALAEERPAELRPSELPQFVAAEGRARGARIDSDAAAFLVQAVGHDLRSLAGAVSQLVDDFPGEPLTVARVQQYFGGRAEAKSFAVADASFSGQRRSALEELRWALEGGTPAVLVTSAFAGSARGLARYLGTSRGLRDVDLAREVGVPVWKLRTIRDQARGWSEAGLSRAIRAVAQADADVKGAASDASYTLERLVLTVCGLREPRMPR